MTYVHIFTEYCKHKERLPRGMMLLQRLVLPQAGNVTEHRTLQLRHSTGSDAVAGCTRCLTSCVCCMVAYGETYWPLLSS